MNNRNIQLVIPMSGIGKRFLEAGYKKPKPLIEVDSYPIIKHILDLFPGIEEVIFVCNEMHLKETDMKQILLDLCPQARIVSVPNEFRKGPVDAVLKAKDFIKNDHEIIVSYCDYGTVWDFDKFLEFTDTKIYDGVIPCYTGFHPHMLRGDNYAFCKTEGLEVLEIKEKQPFTNNKMSEWASNGTYYFKSGKLLKKYFQQLVDQNIHLNNEYYCSLVYNLLIQDGLKVSVFKIDKMLQWGTPSDLEDYIKWSDYFKKPKLETTSTKDFTILLPMAGRGSRFSMEGYDTPKPFLSVDGVPMVVKAIQCLPKATNSVLVCLEDHMEFMNKIKEYFANLKLVSISEVTEGQACSCELGIHEANIDPESPILITACDNGAYYDQEKFSSMLDNKNIDVIVWSFRNNHTSKNNPNMYSWLTVDDNDNILDVSCKKFNGNDPLKSHAIIGTMYFRKAKFFLNGLKKNYEENRRTSNEFYVDDVINQNIKAGLCVKVFEVENYLCWGTPNDYKTYNYWKEHFNNV